MSLVAVTAYLDSPVLTSEEIHFDGLLAAAHPSCRHQPVGRETPLAALARPRLPVCDVRVHRWRIALASVAEYAPEAQLGSVHAVRRRDGWDIEALAQPIHLGLGPGKNTMKRLTIVTSPWVRWWAVGNRREILRLVNRHVHVGQMRSHGYGLVRAWSAEYVEGSDPLRVWIDQGRAARHLPAAVCTAAARVEDGAVEPPYWHPGRVTAQVVPAGTRAAIAPEWVAEIRRLASPEAARQVKASKDAARRARQADRRVPA